MAEEEATADDPRTNFVRFLLGDKRYDVDLFDIDGVEWRDMKRVTNGMTANQITRGVLIGDDMEAIGALVWIWDRRDDPKLTYNDVLRGFGDVRENEEPPGPPA